MALAPRFSLLHSDLNNFLFASIGEEQNGVTLSVVSTLKKYWQAVILVACLALGAAVLSSVL